MKIIMLLFAFIFHISAGAKEFPGQFLGYWEGELVWNRQGDAEQQKVKMKMVILPTDSSGQFHWRIFYGEQDARTYTLKMKDKEKGHWQIDENNASCWTSSGMAAGFRVLLPYNPPLS
jgi:hypothetical protein